MLQILISDSKILILDFKMYRRPFFHIFFATFLIIAIAFAESADSSSVKENNSNNTAISEKKPAYSVSFLPGSTDFFFKFS